MSDSNMERKKEKRLDKTRKIYSKTTYERFLETSDWYEIEVRLNGPGTVATQMVAVDGLLEGLKAIVFLENGWKKIGDADSDVYVSGLDKHFNKVRDHIAASDVLRKHGHEDYLSFLGNPAPQIPTACPEQGAITLIRDEDVHFSFINIIDFGYKNVSVSGSREGLSDNITFLIYLLAHQFYNKDSEQVAALLDRCLKSTKRRMDDKSMDEEGFETYLQPWITAIENQ